MKTDVSLLLGALITERDSLNRAIASLRELSDAPKPKVERASLVRKRPRRTRFMGMTDEIRRQAVEAMRNAGDRSLFDVARECATRFGGAPSHYYTSWRKWERTLMPTPQVDAVSEMEPALAH